MTTELIIPENESIPYDLEQIFSEKPDNSYQLANRWKNSFNSIFAHMTNWASQFFLSHQKTEEITQIQSSIQHLFGKTNYVEKIKNDYEQQNAFLLGYCHAVHQLTDSFESETSYLQNNDLKEVILKYKYITPILKILDKEIELSHNELAEKIGTSASSLSNLMNKVKKYELFNYTKMGKSKYYSLAYPNGKEALKIVRENNNVDEYTKLILEMLDLLIWFNMYDGLKKNNILSKCEKLFMQYTIAPASCKNKLESLALISKSGPIYYQSLIKFEKKAKIVKIFTKDILSEKIFLDTINENIANGVHYSWFYAGTEEFDSEENLKDTFVKQLENNKDFDSAKTEKYKANIQCHIVPHKNIKKLFGNIYDAVIYDNKQGFSCEDKTIDEYTPYIPMSHDTVEKFNQYAKRLTSA